MNKLRVLHIATALSWRGGEQQVAYLLDELKDEVHSIVLCSAGSEMEKHCQQEGIAHFSQQKKGSIDFSFAKRLRDFCREENIDCCHLHDAHAHTFAILAATIYGNKTPLILSRRVDFPIKKNWFSAFKYNHAAIKKILCVSNAIKEITAKGIKDVSKLHTVYSGIDIDKFQENSTQLREELGLGNSDFLVGNTSALADHKDYFTFLDVAEKVIAQDSSFYFLIMGSGPMEEEIKRYAENKSLQGRLKFAGFRTDIPQILSGLDCFFISSKTEGLGTSILDAFACKLPVVATDAGGIGELVIHNESGLLAPVKGVDELSKLLIEIRNKEDLRKRLIFGAWQKVQEFSKSNTAKQTLKHYQFLLD